MRIIKKEITTIHVRQQRGVRRAVAPWIFIHATSLVVFNNHSFCENILTLINHLSSLLRWLTLRQGEGD